MVERRATCSCGQLFIRCRGEPEFIGNCHCFACQRRTGSISGNGAFFTRANILEIGGQSTKFSRKSDRGYAVTNHFCPVCGSTVYWEREMPADWISEAEPGRLDAEQTSLGAAAGRHSASTEAA
jgi:hypothetical protein